LDEILAGGILGVCALLQKHKNGFLCYNRSNQIRNEDFMSGRFEKDLAAVSTGDIILKVNGQ
jgi:hypothetical protein